MAALGATLGPPAQAVTAQPAPKPFAVTTSGLQIVYPRAKPGDSKLPGSFSVKTGGLAVVYPEAKGKPSLPAFKVTTTGLSVVYPSPSPLPKGR